MQAPIPLRGVEGGVAHFEQAVDRRAPGREPAPQPVAVGRSVAFAAGRTIESRAEPAVVSILEGRVSLYIAARSYREIFIREYAPGSLLYLPAFGEDEDFSVRYDVVENAKAIILPVKELIHSSADEDGALDMLHLASRDFKRSCFRVMHKLAFMPVGQRLYCELLRRDAVADGEGKFVLPAHQILAQQLITTRETISREITFLRKQNVIEVSGNFASVVNRGFLMRKVRVALDLETEGDVRAYVG